MVLLSRHLNLLALVPNWRVSCFFLITSSGPCLFREHHFQNPKSSMLLPDSNPLHFGGHGCGISLKFCILGVTLNTEINLVNKLYVSIISLSFM